MHRRRSSAIARRGWRGRGVRRRRRGRSAGVGVGRRRGAGRRDRRRGRRPRSARRPTIRRPRRRSAAAAAPHGWDGARSSARRRASASTDSGARRTSPASREVTGRRSCRLVERDSACRPLLVWDQWVMRAFATLAWSWSSSMPRKRRCSRMAAMPVVPDPQKGSSTSPSCGVARRMSQRMSSRGLTVGCALRTRLGGACRSRRALGKRSRSRAGRCWQPASRSRRLALAQYRNRLARPRPRVVVWSSSWRGRARGGAPLGSAAGGVGEHEVRRPAPFVTATRARRPVLDRLRRGGWRVAGCGRRRCSARRCRGGGRCRRRGRRGGGARG